MGKDSRESSKRHVSEISSNGIKDSNQSNTTIRANRVQDSGLSESDTRAVREQSDSTSESERPRSVDNDTTKQTIEITKIDVEWSLFLLHKWYNANIQVIDTITYGLPELKTTNQLDVGLTGLPDIRRLQQEALKKLQEKAENNNVVIQIVPPKRPPTIERLKQLLEKIGKNYDVDLLTTSDINFLLFIVNRFTTLQMTVSQAFKLLKTKTRIMPKPPKQTTQEQLQPKQLTHDEELEKEMYEIENG